MVNLSHTSDKYVIRFTVTSQYTTDEDIIRDWNEIKEATSIIISEHEQASKTNSTGKHMLGR